MKFVRSLTLRHPIFFRKFGELVRGRKEVFVPARLIFPASEDLKRDLKQFGEKGLRRLFDPAIEFELRSRHGDEAVDFFRQHYGVQRIYFGGVRNLWRKGVRMAPLRR